MSRLQKKCFLGVTTAHGLLLLALLIGPGFFSQPKPVDDAPMIEIMPMMAVNEERAGGGTPRAAVNPQPQPQPQPPQPTPTPPPPRPEVVEPPKPEPQKVDPPKLDPPKVVQRDADPQPKKPTPQPPKHQVKVSDRVVKLADAKSTTKPSSTPTDNKPNAEVQRALARVGHNISSGLSSTTKVEMPEGPGGGGVSYAGYGQIVRKRYADAWNVPDDMVDDEATIKVSVTIARDGKVLSARILQNSGSAAADRSIQNTLDRISEIGIPFPEGAKESQRTFIMTFNLKAKKAFG